MMRENEPKSLNEVEHLLTSENLEKINKTKPKNEVSVEKINDYHLLSSSQPYICHSCSYKTNNK